MLRLEQATRPDDLARFEARARAVATAPDPRPGATAPFWSLEAKVAGAPVTLVFEDGVLAAATHGRSGGPPRDVTEHVRAIRSAPIRLASDRRPVPRVLVVHATATLRATAFARLRRGLQSAGREGARTIAEAAAEAMALRDSAQVACWPLDLVAHDVAPAGDGLAGLSRQPEVREALVDWGFCVVDALGEADDLPGVLAVIETVTAVRDELPWELDGVVIKRAALDARGADRPASATAEPVSWAASVPVEPRRALTRVVDLGCAIDRFGGLRLVATLRPVAPEGEAEVTCALVPDARCAPELADLRVGDRVRVAPAPDEPGLLTVGELSPASESLRGEPFTWPTTCPSCGLELAGARRRRYCPNRHGCAEQVHARLRHFVAAAADGEAAERLARWVEGGLVHAPEDLLRLTTADLADADPLAAPGRDGPAPNLYQALRGAHPLPLERLLFALSVPGLDPAAARALAAHFGDLERLASAAPDDLQARGDLGPAGVAALRAYLDEPRNRATLRALAELGLDAPHVP